MKIVIIEDEKLTAKDLVRTIQSVDPSAEIVSVLHSVEDALAYFEEARTMDLIFSDIQLGDGLSFEIFEKSEIKVPIIYCTAFNQYALEAFKTLGIDYLVKPFSTATVEKALEKYRTMKHALQAPREDYADLISALKKQMNPAPASTSVIVQQGDKIIPLKVENIALFYIDKERVFAHTFEGKKLLLSQKLNDLEQSYPNKFFRANRQFLVNRKAVKEASHYFNRKILVHLTIPFDTQILVGKLKVSAFLSWLANT